MEKCLFCGSTPSTFPVILKEGRKHICDECCKLIPDYAFVRCQRCGNTTAMEVTLAYKEDTIMEACFKQGMNKLEVAEELITTQWTPLILTIDSCSICEED